jgi:8-oxo-dGTP pyrophosphatase MutT (NUDIX family)
MPVQPRLASAVMLLRDHPSGQAVEVFMVRRAVQSEFMPDVFVFPGGSVHADDRKTEETEDICTPVAPTAADPEGRTALGTGTRAAAIRELFEEAGILLTYRLSLMLALTDENIPRFNAYRQAFNEHKGSLIELAHSEQLKLATDHLGYFAHWITPDVMPKRYDTHFFLTTAPEEQEAAYDRLETTDGIWVRPSEALERYQNNDFPLVFATIHQLRDLATFSNVKEALESTITRYVPTRMPVVVMEDGKPRIYLSDDPDSGWDVPDSIARKNL